MSVNIINALEDSLNTSITENGALGFKTSGHFLLDMNFKVSSYRTDNESDIIKDFKKALAEDESLALKWLFYARDIRGGLGERRMFRIIFKWLIENNKNLEYLIPLVPEYGRFDDLLILNKADDYIIERFTKDIELCTANKINELSLLAKWMPSINCTNQSRKMLAKKFASKLGMNPRTYRKTLSHLRAKLDIVERKMASCDWNKINYSKVPSKANVRYANAFMNHDPIRREAFLANVEKGNAKINSSTNFPHDIVAKILSSRNVDHNLAMEQLWKALPKYNIQNTLVVADGSGSMDANIGNTNTTALAVANALAIYFAENNSGIFKDKYITFSDNPVLVDLSVKADEKFPLARKLEKALGHCEVASTNIEAVFSLILKSACDNNLSNDDMPKNILIISDMEFNSATDGKPNAKLFEMIKRNYSLALYQLPRLIFWNVNSRTDTIPLKENDLGVALVSGFSPVVANMIMSNELDPYKCLTDVLMSDRYKNIG